MPTLLQHLARQARALWNSSDYGFLVHEDVACNDGPVTDADFNLFEVRRKALLEAEGCITSLVTPGYEYPAGGVTLLDVLRLAQLHSLNGYETPAAEVLWAPTQSECVAAEVPVDRVRSTCLVPSISGELMAALWNGIPAGLLPRQDDTAEALSSRVSASSYLDDANVPLGGHGRGGRTERINASGTHRQPRRSSRSVRAGPIVEHDHHPLQPMYHYSNFRRAPVDSYSFCMTPAHMDLNVLCWLAARHVLAEKSKDTPFTHCQQLFYYELFNSHMKQHRDNASKRSLSKLCSGFLGSSSYDPAGTCTGIGDSTCQVPGSSVAVYTIGTKAMTLKIRYPHRDNLDENIKDYVVHPKFIIRVGPGTLFILDPEDDVWFTHECEFPCIFGDDNGVRVAFVFRHCQKLHLFKTDAKSKRYIDPEALATEKKAKQKRRADKVAADRRRRLTSMF